MLYPLNSSLHLIKPFGFELSDSRLKRAGLDYWKHVPIFIYDNKKRSIIKLDIFDNFLNRDYP